MRHRGGRYGVVAMEVLVSACVLASGVVDGFVITRAVHVCV